MSMGYKGIMQYCSSLHNHRINIPTYMSADHQEKRKSVSQFHLGCRKEAEQKCSLISIIQVALIAHGLSQNQQ